MLKAATYYCAVLLALAGVVTLQWRLPQKPAADSITFRFNERMPAVTPEVGRVMSFGYAQAFGAMLWLRFLQYIPAEKVPVGEISWLYYDLDTISAVDPDFTPVFTQGGLFLSVITEDRAGARKILERGAALHPDNWRILSALAYHFMFEERRPDLAGPYYLAASQVPGAPEVFSLMAATHINRSQGIDASIAFLERFAESSKEEIVRKKLLEKIAKLKAEKGAQ
jgi:hypothetical protein